MIAKMLNRLVEKCSGSVYFVFRVLIGFLFLLHGIQKLPGIVSGKTAAFSLFWLAGVIESIAGTLVIIGLFVRYASVVTAIEMLVAFFYVHVGSGVWHPLKNGGEPALLFFAAFLILV
ncbi:DoxX family protein, partial [Candidatus Woesearchaeota archaeon]|nr:DoxX family protein [Candidatus Woesearchaeota archaeon]